MSGAVKQIKGGKTEDELESQTITLRGTTYTVREATVTEYKECVAAATDKETGFTPFGALLEHLTMRLVTPSPAARSTPLPYPIYRRLEGIINEMHFVDIESDEEKAAREKGEAEDGDDEAPEDEQAPNS